MDTLLSSIRASWASCQIGFITLVITMVLDILGGMIVAFGTGAASSTISRKGIARKIFKLLTIALCAVVDSVVQGPIPLATIACVFYMKTEGLSLLEKAGKLGIIPPGKLLDALAQVREQSPPGAAAVATVTLEPSGDVKATAVANTNE